METIIQILARELGQKEQYVENVVKLLDDGNTVPFIARYRKEMHGTMDDQTIRQLAERLAYLRGLDERRAEADRHRRGGGDAGGLAPRQPEQGLLPVVAHVRVDGYLDHLSRARSGRGPRSRRPPPR